MNPNSITFEEFRSLGDGDCAPWEDRRKAVELIRFAEDREYDNKVLRD